MQFYLYVISPVELQSKCDRYNLYIHSGIERTKEWWSWVHMHQHHFPCLGYFDT